MNYLKNYSLSDEEIEDVKRAIEEREVNIDTFLYNPEKIISILDLFVAIGVTNIYEIMMINPTMFCDTVDSVRNRINKYEDKDELARLINEDVLNLALVGLL